MSSPFDPFDPPEIVLEPPPIPEIRIDPPESDTIHVVAVPGPPGDDGPPGEPGPPGGISESAAQDMIDTSIGVHVAAPEPHPAYDDLPSIRLIFENGLI